MAAKNIYQRLHAVMLEVDYIQKEKKNGMNYTIVSHDAVTAKVRPALVKHGVVYYPVSINRNQDGNRTELDVVVRFVNIDEPTDYVDVACVGYGIDAQDKGPGKATSYAVKYALLKALGLETGDDADLDSVSHEPPPRHDPPKPVPLWERASYELTVNGDAEKWAKTFCDATAKAPSDCAVMKLAEDNDGHLKSINQKLYEACQAAMSARMAFFSQHPTGKAA